ncbi:MAG: hypothetical protein B7Y01_04475 [Xanthobacter sp. 17-67-6]|nr:MAG: hypothetical protein B7Y01_04475 [Xanthobacter sp. 17-67-6]
MLNILPVGQGEASAVAVADTVAELPRLARGVQGYPFGLPTAALQVPRRAPMQLHEGGYYIRLAAVNKPGTAATIAGRMADEGISLESIVQHRPTRKGDGEQATVILITYATTEEAVRRAVAAIEAEGVIANPPQVIRIEKD